MNARLDSRSLAQFIAVAETLSFRQAAETLHMSQPPLSRAIKDLETRLGARLFDRDTQRVELTTAGKRLLPLGRRILRLLAEAEAAVASVDAPLRLRIGLTNAVEPQWFERLAAAIQGSRPQSSLQVLSDASPRLVRMVDAKRLDAAFIALPTQTPGLDVVALDRQPMMVAMASSHRLARRRAVRLADLREDPLFWFERSRQPAFYDYCRKVFAQHGFAPATLKEPQDHHVLLAEVASGRGVAFLPASFAALRRQGVSYKRLAEGAALSVAVGLVTQPDRRELRDFLLACAGAKALRPSSAGAGPAQGG